MNRYAGKQGDFALAIGKFVEETKNDMTDMFRAVAINIGNSVIRMSPVDTGRFRGEWQFSIGTPPASQTGRIDKDGSQSSAELVSGALQFKAGDQAWITNLLPYAIPLEYGHSDQAPNGMVRVTMARVQQIITDAVNGTQG